MIELDPYPCFGEYGWERSGRLPNEEMKKRYSLPLACKACPMSVECKALKEEQHGHSSKASEER